MRVVRSIALLFAAIIMTNTAFAAFGDIDTTFGNNGTVTFHTLPNGWIGSSYPSIVLRQSDGKLIVVGTVFEDVPNTDTNRWYLTIKRYNTNGTIDNSYGSSGTAIPYNTYGQPASAAIDSNGKLLVGGKHGNYPSVTGPNYIWRFNTNGWYDSGFGSQGRVSVGTSGQTVMDVDSIRLTANSTTPSVLYEFAGSIKRLNSNGTPDNSFGNGGALTGLGKRFVKRDATLFSNASIITAHFVSDGSLTLRGFNGNGQVDSGFGMGGSSSSYIGGSANQIANFVRSPQGKLVVHGPFTVGAANSGSFISSHGGSGFMENSTVFMTWVYSSYDPLTVNADGSIVVGYDGQSRYLSKYTSNLVLVEYSNAANCRGLLAQPDGKLVCVTFENSIKRFLQ